VTTRRQMAKRLDHPQLNDSDLRFPLVLFLILTPRYEMAALRSCSQ
jgi:hypothetical protein